MASQYRFHQDISHNGLHKTKTIKANSRRELNDKVQIQMAQWEEQYQKKLVADMKRIEAERKKQERQQKAKDAEKATLLAKRQTEEAEQLQQSLDQILINSLNPKIYDFENMKDYSAYSVACPVEPQYEQASREPDVNDEAFNPKPSFFTKLSKVKMEQFNQENKNKFERSHADWVEAEKLREANNQQMKESYSKSVEMWEEGKKAFEREQSEKNESVEEFKKNVINGEAEAVSEYIVLSLNIIDNPLEYTTEYEAEYNNDNKMAIVDVTLPTVEDIPTLKSVSYIKTKEEFKESYFSEAQTKKKYDSVIYQMILQTLNTIFKIGTQYDIIDSAVVNGKINTIDKSTGKEISPYVLSVTVSKTDFKELNLNAIDPKAWFKSAKGVSAASLTTVTPVAPIVVMDKDDKRFIEGYDVAESLDESVNLAAMDWQDFENLIREVFAKEFNSNGGEVKITQASRDGGVDAVAFDPDPIRGGKIVIQAKRYTKVVGVSAVRDLYGTLMNEGAMKGILVTTSNYGNDAYEFAKGKPLQLLNGANLLSLIEKHGHKARINLKEAKETLQESN